MSRSTDRPTRGSGLLETFLSRWRVRKALSLMPDSKAGGRVLDVGCGSNPVFLSMLRGFEAHGIDKSLSDEMVSASGRRGIFLINHDFSTSGTIPYGSGHFSVVTMLAVFEHLEHGVLDSVLAETYRVLEPGGVFIMTTPAWWTDPLLRTMARVGLVSSEEIDEHVDAYDHKDIFDFLHRAGFQERDIELGWFQLFMNNWGRAFKRA